MSSEDIGIQVLCGVAPLFLCRQGSRATQPVHGAAPPAGRVLRGSQLNKIMADGDKLLLIRNTSRNTSLAARARIFGGPLEKLARKLELSGANVLLGGGSPFDWSGGLN